VRILNGDVELFVEVDGDPTSTPLLLLHGITSSGRSWEWFVPTLAATHRVVRLDFRGHGRSGRATGAYLMADYLSDAAAVCREVVGRECVVIGHSLGGATAAALAQVHPEFVSALVLEDPPLAHVDDVAAADHALFAAFGLMRQMVPQLQSGGMTVDALAAVIAGLPTSAGRPFVESMHADTATVAAASLLELDATVLDPVLDRSLRPVFDPDVPIVQPTLVVAADPASPDCVARPDDIARVVAASPQIEVVTLPGATHLVHDERAHRDAFARLVTEFLARCAR
jgi:esterase